MSPKPYAFDLRSERPLITSMVRQAASRYMHRFGTRPVNAVEVGFWVEGARLVVRLISNPAYEFNWITYPLGYSDTEGSASFAEFTPMPSWELLGQLSGSTGLLVREDDSGKDVRLHKLVDDRQVGWRETVKAIGRNVMRAVVESQPDVLDGVNLRERCEVTVYEDEDSSLAWYYHVLDGRLVPKT